MSHYHGHDHLWMIVQNLLSVSYLTASARLSPMIPPPERRVEWILGILVGMSILCYNVIRIIQAIRRKNHKDHE